MEHVIRAVWIILIVTVHGVVSQQADVSTPDEIDSAAKYLNVDVIVETNHEIGGTYTIVLKLTNAIGQTLLPKADWSIIFHSQNKITTPQLSSDSELEVLAAENCLYVIQPVATSSYDGFQSQESKTIELQATGLSLFKSEIFPNFAIYSSQVSPLDIRYTQDNELSFVTLAAANQSADDPSLMNGVQRILSIPDVIDGGRVPQSYVIPSAMTIRGQPNQIMDLQTADLNILFGQTVPQNFRDLFIDTLASIPNITRAKINQVNRAVRNRDMIYVNLLDPMDPRNANNPKIQAMTEDGYHLYVRRAGASKHDVTILAKNYAGLQNSVQTLRGLIGLYTAIPILEIEDDTSFPMRSISLDLTKNFFGLGTLKKLIDVMAMYKLNYLILDLADNYGWRLEMNGTDFEELHTFGSQRCVDQNRCLPPLFGAGASGTSGYLTAAAYKELIKYAMVRQVYIIPKINYAGGMYAAKRASQVRYERLKDINLTDASRLLLFGSGAPDAQSSQQEGCFVDAVLNPCIPQTEEFIRFVNNYIIKLYTEAEVPLKGIHAGGDEGVKLYQHYPECKAEGLTTTALLRKMVNMIQRNNPVLTGLNEEAVVDPDTKDCIPIIDPSGGGLDIDSSRLVVVFHRDILVDIDNWGLTKEEEDFIFGPIEPPPDPTNETTAAAYEPDFKKRYRGISRGILAPWAKAYTCANAGYKVIMNPEAYTNLESAYELSWDETGNHKPDRYSVINRHRMMLLEPKNIHINIDQTTDMTPLLPHRLCQVFECPTLTPEGDKNILGLQASICTSVIRTEQKLFETTISRIIMHAEKAWRRAPFENMLKPTNLSTYDDMEANTRRSQFLLTEMTNHLNTYGYKERGRLDAIGIPYRVGRVGAAISNALAAFQPQAPPFPVVVKTDQPGSPVQYRDQSDRTWRHLYWINRASGAVEGGYTFNFPISDQKLELRLVSADSKRAGKPTILQAEGRFLFPPVIPITLRNNTCLDPETPNINILEVTPQQWVQVINNLQPFTTEVAQFGQNRMRVLLEQLNYYKQFNSSVSALGLFEVLNGIEQLMNMEQPLYGVYKYIFDQDQGIMQRREQELAARYGSWKKAYLQNCKQTTTGGGPGRRGGPPPQAGHARRGGSPAQRSPFA